MEKALIVKSDKNLTWRLINEYKTGDYIAKLFEVYAIDKDKARIYYHLNKRDCKFCTIRSLLFESKNGDFRIVRIRKSYGISITGKMYSHEKNLDSITYSRKSGFFHISYVKSVRNITQLTYMSFSNFLVNFNVENEPNIVYEYLVNRFGWIRNIRETTFWSLSFNVIKRNKLYNKKAILRHVYGCPYPQAKMVHDYTMSRGGDYSRVWVGHKKNLVNIENLSTELFLHPLFMDSCNMAQMVNTKINCSWSVKRLKSEHDKWSKIITQVLIDTEPLRELKVGEVFKEFAKHSGFELLTTNHALLEEGCRMNHCVGTYSSKVDSGLSGIYRALGYTLEMILVNNGQVYANDVSGSDTTQYYTFRIGQYMDIGNMIVPSEALDIVNEKVISFQASRLFTKDYVHIDGSFKSTRNQHLITDEF